MKVFLAGRAAEQIVFGRVTNGAANDLEKATGSPARWSSSTAWASGLLAHDARRQLRALGGDEAAARPRAGPTHRRGIEEAPAPAPEAPRRRSTAIAKELLEKETLDKDELGALLADVEPESRTLGDRRHRPRRRRRPTDQIASPAWRRAGSTTWASPSTTSTRRCRRTSGCSAPGSSIASRARPGRRGGRRCGSAPAASSCSPRSATRRRSASSSPGAAPGCTTSRTRSTTSAALDELPADGAELIDEEPRRGLFGLQVAFVHPDAVHGVLTEIVSLAERTGPDRDRLRRRPGDERPGRAAVDALERALDEGGRRVAARRGRRPLPRLVRRDRVRQALRAREPRRLHRLPRVSGRACRAWVTDERASRDRARTICAARRAGAAGRPRGARGAVPAPFRPDLRLPPLTVGNRHDAEDLTTQTFLKMLESIGRFRWQSAPFSAWLFRIAHNLAMDHFRATRRWQPEEEVPEPEGADERRPRTARCSRSAAEHARADRGALARAAAGADAEVRLQLLERRGGDDPRQDRGRGEVAAAPRARVAAEASAAKTRHRGRSKSGSSGCRAPARRRSSPRSRRAGVGRTTARRTSGWRRSPTSGSTSSRRRRRRAKVTPATIRVRDVPGTGPGCSATCARWTRCSSCSTGTRTARPGGDLENLKLELLVADRDHVERRLERVEAGEVRRREAARGGRRARADPRPRRRGRRAAPTGTGELPAELEPLTTKPVLAVENGPGGIDLKLEAELAELPDEEAAAFRDGRVGARASRPRGCPRRSGPITFFTAGEKETRGWTLRRGQTALDARGRSTRTSRAASSAARSSAGRPRRDRQPRGGRARGCSGSRARRTSSRTATS